MTMRLIPMRSTILKQYLHSFLHWFTDAPLYKSIWFIPLVAVLYLAALIRNNFFTNKEIK